MLQLLALAQRHAVHIGPERQCPQGAEVLTGVSVGRHRFGSEIYAEVVDFLIDEAWLLDDGDLKTWLGQMP